MTMYLAPFVALIGLLLYWICTGGAPQPKLARIGEIALFCGLLVTLIIMSSAQATASFKIH